MILKTDILEERCLEIYEQDIINNRKVLILKVYCVRKNNEIWEFPSPQIFNQDVYEENKEEYNSKILSFRNDCQNENESNLSLILEEIDDLKKEIEGLKGDR